MTHTATTNISETPPSPWKTLAHVNHMASLGLTVSEIAAMLCIATAAHEQKPRNNNDKILSDAPLNVIFTGPNGEQD